MNSSRKPLSLLIALLLPLWSLSAGAVGLGELTARSNLGEPLRAEIRLLSQGGPELDPNCVRRVSPADSDEAQQYQRLLPGVPLASLRDAALALQAGGVGYYPKEQFVHLDTGRVRSW